MNGTAIGLKQSVFLRRRKRVARRDARQRVLVAVDQPVPVLGRNVGGEGEVRDVQRVQLEGRTDVPAGYLVAEGVTVPCGHDQHVADGHDEPVDLVERRFRAGELEGGADVPAGYLVAEGVTV